MNSFWVIKWIILPSFTSLVLVAFNILMVLCIIVFFKNQSLYMPLEAGFEFLWPEQRYNHLLRQRKKGQKYRREIVSVNHLYINEGMIANFITFFQWFLFPIENIVDIVNPFKLWSNYRVTFTLLKYGWEKGKRKCWNFANN